MFDCKDIEDMDQATFEFCKEHLWELLGYKVLKKEDVRKIDLEERILELEERYLSIIGKNSNSGYSVFFQYIKMYFEDFLRCADGKRPAKYYQLATEIIDNAVKSGKVSWENLRTLIMIYVSLFRVRYGTQKEFSVDNIKKTVIEVADFSVEESDVLMLEEIRNNKSIVPIDLATHVEKKGILKDKYERIPFPEKKIIAGKNFLYMISLIILADTLEEAGLLD